VWVIELSTTARGEPQRRKGRQDQEFMDWEILGNLAHSNLILELCGLGVFAVQILRIVSHFVELSQ
jgi:hypothetical protein